MRICLRRREFIAGLGGVALTARAQQGDRVRRIGAQANARGLALSE